MGEGKRRQTLGFSKYLEQEYRRPKDQILLIGKNEMAAKKGTKKVKAKATAKPNLLKASAKEKIAKNVPDLSQQYNEIYNWYDQHRTKDLMEKEYLEIIIQSIPKEGSILDLGCGTGEPLAKFFIEKGYRLTGIDVSQKMIELCQERFPGQNFLVADMRTIALKKQFDAIIAWDSFFHLSGIDQRAMFKIFVSHLKSGGILAFTSGPSEGEVWNDNGGQNLYHASLSQEEYRRLLTEYHFEVLLHKIEDPDCGNHTVWVVALK